jgi:hypothetical protein
MPPQPPEHLVDAPAEAPEPVDNDVPLPTRRQKRSERRAAVPRPPASTGQKVAIVAASVFAFVVILVLGISAVATVSSVIAEDPVESPQAVDPVIVDEWTTYPGNAYVDSADVFDDPSMETIVQQGNAFVEEYKTALTAEFGLTWTPNYPEYLETASNGYGGDSMLYDFDSSEWQGPIVLNDAGARERVFEIFDGLLTKYGALDHWLSNDLYDDDPDASKSQFGAEKLDDQPMWTFYGTDLIVTGSTARSRVFDSNLARDPSFEGDIWFELEDVPSGSLVVTVSYSAYNLLSESDRDEFTDRLSQYDESNKPAGR